MGDNLTFKGLYFVLTLMSRKYRRNIKFVLVAKNRSIY